LDLSLIVAGTKYRGQFEERLKQIMRELVENPQYIVFIDELHTLVGAGSAEGSARRRQHLETRVVARRDSVYRRDHAGGVSQVH
jgi:ATP-dependent Clp protease ATP-binding subunit ClpA